MRASFIRKPIFIAVAVLIVSLIANCGGGAAGPNPAPTPGATGRFLYAVSGSSSVVASYAISTSSGVLSASGSTLLSGGARALTMAVDPLGRYLFVARLGGGIEVFAIDGSTGSLSLVPGSPFDLPLQALYLTVHPAGRALWATRTGNLTIDTLAINPATGALSSGSNATLQLTVAPSSPAIRPDGRFFYFGAGPLPQFMVASVDATSSSLTLGTPVTTSDAVRSITPDPAGNFLYVTTATPFTSGTLFLYRLNQSTGGGAIVPGSVFATGFDPAAANLRPDGVTFDPAGRFAFVMDRAGRTGAHSNGVFVFPVQSSGLLGPSALGPYSTPPSALFLNGDPISFTLDASGRFAFMSDATTNTISAFAVDQTTGALIAAGPAVPSPPAAVIVVKP